ncbi:uncharacterized protein EDB91DRAFT_1113832, partial [Suillus paluster]|uniref:uncharacterized protein n=1 Tax=Suillus paluster TaxID=48578 RepID=UPI001B863D70
MGAACRHSIVVTSRHITRQLLKLVSLHLLHLGNLWTFAMHWSLYDFVFRPLFLLRFMFLFLSFIVALAFLTTLYSSSCFPHPHDLVHFRMLSITSHDHERLLHHSHPNTYSLFAHITFSFSLPSSLFPLYFSSHSSSIQASNHSLLFYCLIVCFTFSRDFNTAICL